MLQPLRPAPFRKRTCHSSKIKGWEGIGVLKRREQLGRIEEEKKEARLGLVFLLLHILIKLNNALSGYDIHLYPSGATNLLR